MRHPRSCSYAGEALRFLAGVDETFTADLRPQAARKLRNLERQRAVLLAAIPFRIGDPIGSLRRAGSALRRRLEGVRRAETQLAFDCYWQDLGGEG